MYRLIIITAWAILALFPPVAGAQEASDKDSILVDIVVNYGVAFRNASWVPIDVLVRNTERDVNGYIEISTFNFNGEAQSPTFRLPAESPRNSNKRFRLYCRMEQVDRIEAQLYHRDRPVLVAPTWLKISAIAPNDYLGLILDDNHQDYGFLSDTKVIGVAERRFHREGLKTDQLALLADQLPCYTTFDMLIMGNIDPERIGIEQRDLIQQYVSLGGTLIVNLGANADRYKGSWLEPLLGVNIGANTFQSEPALAQTALNLAPNAPGLSENRKGMVTTLTPTIESLESLGIDFSLGSVRKVGSGHIVTFTVDAASGLLRNQDVFLQRWNRFLSQSLLERPMNLGAVVAAASIQMPAIAGVRLFPISSVIIYLLLYFFVAIVANWLFWNWMKRREMAWVCLVFFSLAFTSYAMIFGTQGRARSTQLEEIEILELSSNNEVARLHGLTGLLAKGSGRFDATLIHPDTLVADATRSQDIGTNQTRGLFSAQSQKAFQFVQEEPGRIEGLRVGASEMRFIQTEAPIRLDGALDVALTLSSSGLHGDITNNTGLTLHNPQLIFGGLKVPLEKLGNTYSVSSALYNDPALSAWNPAYISASPEQAMTTPDDIDAQTTRNFIDFLARLPSAVLTDEEHNLPPCLIAWKEGPPLGSVDMGDRATTQFGATLVVAWLTVDDERTKEASVIDVPVRMRQANLNYGRVGTYQVQRRARIVDPDSGFFPDETFYGPLAADGSDWNARTNSVFPEDEIDLFFDLPDWARGRSGYILEITTSLDEKLYTGEHDDQPCEIADTVHDRGYQLPLQYVDAPTNAPPLDTAASTRSIRHGTEQELKETTYRLDYWPELMAPRSTSIHLQSSPLDRSGRSLDYLRGTIGGLPRNSSANIHYHTYISAQLIKTDTQTVGD